VWRPGSEPSDSDPSERQERRIADPHSTLVLGGSASGKSRYAELLLAAEPNVRYLATGRPSDGSDPEWDAKVAIHRGRRPPSWSNAEIPEPGRLCPALLEPGACLLWDSVGTWLTAVLDDAGAWDDEPGWRDDVARSTDALVEAWRGAPNRRVAVAEEVGWGVVPATTSGRLFQHELGTLNQRLAAASDQVRLVVAGRVLDLRRGFS
jgi:adenosylcobinamide kinase/adenosylcobinamide-phosphate guanylyltransferase